LLDIGLLDIGLPDNGLPQFTHGPDCNVRIEQQREQQSCRAGHNGTQSGVVPSPEKSASGSAPGVAQRIPATLSVAASRIAS